MEMDLKSNIKQFEKSIQAHLKKIEKNTKDAWLARMSFWILRRLQQRTPVDTGRARAGWKLEKISGGWQVINRVHYTVYLEYGHSKQAEQGMVRITLSELQEKLKHE